MATRDYLNPLFPNVIITPNLDYRQTPAPGFVLDMYMPDTSPVVPIEGQKFPVIIYAHGGEFKYGSKADGGPVKFCTEMARRGYTCLSIDYPTNPVYTPVTSETNATAAMHDVIRWVWAMTDTYNFDTSKIIVAGDSAGACMAVMSAIGSFEGPGNSSYTAFLGKRPAAVLDFWGPTQIYSLPLGAPPFTTNIAAGKLDKCIIVHGTEDVPVPIENSYALSWVRGTYRPSFGEIPIRKLVGAGHTPWYRVANAQGFYEDAFQNDVVYRLGIMMGLIILQEA